MQDVPEWIVYSYCAGMCKEEKGKMSRKMGKFPNTS